MSDGMPLGGLTSAGGLTLAATGVAEGMWWLVAIAALLIVVGVVILRISFRRRSELRRR